MGALTNQSFYISVSQTHLKFYQNLHKSGSLHTTKHLKLLAFNIVKLILFII